MYTSYSHLYLCHSHTATCSCTRATCSFAASPFPVPNLPNLPSRPPTSTCVGITSRSAFFQFLMCDALEELIQQSVDSSPWLASTPDADGHMPANVASPSNLKVLAKHLFFLGQFELKKGAPEHKSATSIVTR